MGDPVVAGPSRPRLRSAQTPKQLVTYRHLLSPQALTPTNPLRVIAHCDIDAAYAQFEQKRLGIADDVPLAVLQWEGMVAVNYPARRFGISRFGSLEDAKKKCPDLVLVHVATYKEGSTEAGYWDKVDSRTHKVSLDPYRRESQKILKIFKEMVAVGEVEKASIDEAFLDLTSMAIARLLVLHPHLAAVPHDGESTLDTPLPPAPPIDWGKAGNIFPINGENKHTPTDPDGDAQALNGDDDGNSDDEEDRARARANSEANWEDWALCLGAEIMAEIRAAIRERLGYTCSAGIAHNKVLSKLCSAWKKPNNQTVLRQAAVPAFLRPMDFTDIRFLGGKLGKAIAAEYQATTVGDMLTVPLDDMQKKFGEESIWVWNILRGVDHSEVKEKLATKSMLASKNVQPSVTTPQQGYHWLSVLGGELNVRLREAREVAPGLWPKTLVVSVRQGFEPSRSRQAPFPYHRNLSTEYIVKIARKVWDDLTQPLARGMKLHNISLGFHGLERLEAGQKNIEGFFAITPAGEVPLKSGKRSRSSSPLAVAGPSEKRPRGTTSLAKPSPDKDEERSSASLTPTIESVGSVVSSWKCPRCSFRCTSAAIVDGEDPLVAAQAFSEQRQEHNDYHYAKDLSEGRDPEAAKKRVGKSKKKKPEGIKAFFGPRKG